MTVEQRRDQRNDQFPVGMRVLAVDDDPICLRLLETLLRKCQYHVTTTTTAINALKMLRENRNNFDLVISDVHMPDMDGFKLLELVGLEMDLPVIMLSANGDTKLVMKGITHGACDYLLKPVRLEELKLIWQHVWRKKKVDPKDPNNCNSLERNPGVGNGIGGANADQDAKHRKKRKDQYVDDDEGEDENDSENDDSSTQKKPRVVWSVELHRKFVAAVNQLGLEKAVPKKILELMNVDKLTRENVASHLQKYRLYLKRISSVANQVAAFGGPDYLRMNSVNYHNFHASPHFQNNSYRPVPTAGVHCRLNTPAAGLGLHGLSPSAMVQLGHSQFTSSSIPDSTKFPTGLLTGDQTATVLQGMPTSLEFDQLQHKRGVIGVEDLCPTNNIVSGSSNSLLSLPNISLTMQGHSQERASLGSIGVTSEPLPNLFDQSRCNSSWPAAVQSQASSTYHMENMVSPSISVQSRLQDSRSDAQCQVGLMSDNMGQNVSYACKPGFTNHGTMLDGSVNSLLGSAYTGAPAADPRSTSAVPPRNGGFGSMGQPRFDSLANQQNPLVHNSGVDMALKMKQGQFVDHGGRSLANHANNGAGSLEDVVTAMFNRV